VIRYKAILFDFDGVLVDTEWAIYVAWRDCFAEHGQELPLAIYTRCIGSDFETWSPKTYLEELTGREFDWILMDQERQVAIRDELAEEGPMPGLLALLEHLSAQGITLAVVSSSSHQWVDGWLEKLDLAQYFSYVVCRGDAPRIKPAPDLWLEALRLLGLHGNECLAIEDSRNGLISAKAAGLAVWIAPNRVTSVLNFDEADQCFRDFAELAEIWVNGEMEV
jgi:putative hydrolase of the HAD superfamily